MRSVHLEITYLGHHKHSDALGEWEKMVEAIKLVLWFFFFIHF